MPVESSVSAGAHRCTREARLRQCGASSNHTSPDESLAGSLYWKENTSGSQMFEFGEACLGIPLNCSGSGFCRRVVNRSAGASASSGSFKVDWERWQNAIVNFFSLFTFFFFFALILTHHLYFVYNSLWCLKLLFIPLSEMYKRISCFEPFEWPIFRKKRLCLVVRRPKKILHTAFQVNCFQKSSLISHLDWTATDLTCGFQEKGKKKSSLYKKKNIQHCCKDATFSYRTCCVGNYLYSVISLLHEHSLGHFLITENQHLFEVV